MEQDAGFGGNLENLDGSDFRVKLDTEGGMHVDTYPHAPHDQASLEKQPKKNESILNDRTQDLTWHQTEKQTEHKLQVPFNIKTYPTAYPLASGYRRPSVSKVGGPLVVVRVGATPGSEPPWRLSKRWCPTSRRCAALGPSNCCAYTRAGPRPFLSRWRRWPSGGGGAGAGGAEQLMHVPWLGAQMARRGTSAGAASAAASAMQDIRRPQAWGSVPPSFGQLGRFEAPGNMDPNGLCRGQWGRLATS